MKKQKMDSLLSRRKMSHDMTKKQESKVKREVGRLGDMSAYQKHS